MMVPEIYTLGGILNRAWRSDLCSGWMLMSVPRTGGTERIGD